MPGPEIEEFTSRAETEQLGAQFPRHLRIAVLDARFVEIRSAVQATAYRSRNAGAVLLVQHRPVTMDAEPLGDDHLAAAGHGFTAMLRVLVGRTVFVQVVP